MAYRTVYDCDGCGVKGLEQVFRVEVSHLFELRQGATMGIHFRISEPDESQYHLSTLDLCHACFAGVFRALPERGQRECGERHTADRSPVRVGMGEGGGF